MALHYVPALSAARPIVAFMASAATAGMVSLLCYLSMERSRRALLFLGTLPRAMRYRKAAI
jgi:hypothetical protein